MAKYADLQKRIEALHAIAGPWAGTVYRSCSVEYSRRADLLTGIGASRFGGRWNPRGIRAVYASLTPETSMAEVLNTANYFGFGASSLMPRVFMGMEVSLAQVLDLTVGQTRQRLGVSLVRMLAEDWRQVQQAGKEALTQQIGRAAMETGLEGIIVPAAPEPTTRNLVWFPDNLQGASRVVVCNADKLPK